MPKQAPHLKSSKRLKQLSFYFILSAITLSSAAHAEGWRYGFGGGFGGTGISKQTRLNGAVETIERSEGPGMLHLFMDKLVSERMVFAFEHSRGFRLGPFTTGMGFYSTSLRYHYTGPAPELIRSGELSNLVFKRWSPYTGFTTGIAAGSISRESDRAATITGSGIHFGLRNGVDVLWKPQMGLRIEVAYSSTFFQGPVSPAVLSEFSLWAGLFFPVF